MKKSRQTCNAPVESSLPKHYTQSNLLQKEEAGILNKKGGLFTHPPNSETNHQNDK